MPHRLTLFTVVFALVALAACSEPTAPANPLRPLLDLEGCDTIWVHPDSIPEPDTYSDSAGCHVYLPWMEQLRTPPEQNVSAGGRNNHR